MTDKLQAVREALQKIHDNAFNWERRSIRDIAAKALPELSANTEAQPSGSIGINRLVEALKFYADGHHFTLHDSSAWDTVSGEPINFGYPYLMVDLR